MKFSLGNGLSRLTRIDNILIISLFLANLPAFSPWYFSWKYFTIEFMQFQQTIMIIISSLLWIMSACLIIQQMKHDNSLADFINSWKSQKLLLAFISVAFLSIFWSVSPLVSVYKVIILLASTLLGSYIGFRLKQSQWMILLFWFGLSLTILSIAFALFLPGIGTMTSYPYDGVWRGVYWHKNHLGSIFALFSAVFLIRMFSGFQRNRQIDGLDAALFVLALMIVYLASSAAGFILAILLNFFIGFIILWLALHARLQRVHYFVISAIGVISTVLVLTNLDIVFGLFNRSPSLTGRTPMWEYLIQNVIGSSPWFGYGYGVIWSLSTFRSGLADAVRWRFPVLVGDNGFIDILLSVGIIGFLPFMGVFVLAWIRSIKHAITRRTLIDFFPLLVMIFALMGNVSYSLFLETESFIWVLMVAVLFIPKHNSEQIGNDNLSPALENQKK